MIQPGRNDPCYCGSGKKYKKCHLQTDEQEAIRRRRELRETEPDPSTAGLQNPEKLITDWTREAQETGEVRNLASGIGLLLEFNRHQAEIKAAMDELQAHRAEFEKFADNERRYSQLAEELFGEEAFTDLRFTAADIRRAFDKVGYPGLLTPDDRTLNILRDAILHLADAKTRMRLAAGLFVRLPEFVAARRYREACMIEACAGETVEFKDECNPFLFQMFSHGYDSWAQEKREKDESLLRQLGIDVGMLRGMSPKELEAFTREQLDPAMLKKFLEENPHLRDESISNIEAMERNSPNLLQRPDSLFLRLSVEETRPWAVRLHELASEHGFLGLRPDDMEAQAGAAVEVMKPFLAEMAASIFTSDRIRKLVADLRRYRDERFKAGDKITAMQATGAISYLEREDSPGENVFLIWLCFMSVDSAAEALATESPTAAT